MDDPAPRQSTTPYNEDEILGLINDIYDVLITLGHFERSEIDYPPAHGRALDFSALRQYDPVLMPVLEPPDFDPRVLSLMKRIPLPVNKSEYCLARDMYPVNYASTWELADSRDVDKLDYHRPEYRLNVTNVKPSVLVLWNGAYRGRPRLLLDVADNTVRLYDWDLVDDYTRNEVDEKKLDEYTDNHMNWPTKHAPTYFRELLQQYRTGHLIPDPYGNIITVHPHAPWTLSLQRILTDAYGWPNKFQREDWLRDKEEILEHHMFSDNT